MTIHTLLEEFRKTATSTRDLGNKFERLMAQYLTTDPLYKVKYSEVWLWMDWPDRDGPDAGIDLVAKERYTSEYCAIQCKCYDPSHTLQKTDIDSFFTASGKQPFTSRLIISTTDKWSEHADKALENQHIPVIRLGVSDLERSNIDWSHFVKTNRLGVKDKKEPRKHQETAIEKVVEGFKNANRGKLIMACGTGKTFTALRIAENMASNNGYVLFLVPSISLLSQTLREWSSETRVSLNSFTVCSDTKVNKKNEDIHVYDLAFPATTYANQLLKQVKSIGGKNQLTVIFSTYHSIQTLSDAQAKGLPEFDLIVCDEAHRTTGVTLEGQEESYFVKVHNQDFIKAKKRLYMTATPRIYSDDVKAKAEENVAELCSMDDENIYGPEFHRLGFSEAVSNDLLSDYQVMILAVDEKYVKTALDLTDEDTEIDLDDAVRIIGCWNGLSKRLAKEADYIAARSDRVGRGLQPSTTKCQENNDLTPMRRAVAFSRSIKDSKQITELFLKIVNKYHENRKKEKGRVNKYNENRENRENLIDCDARHVDGTFNALKRNERLDWLKQEPPANTCRILSNARCLSEGIDVPALDAVMFLNPRNSVVDVVQSVGRVMRKSEGKKYGYIILPIGVPTNVRPEIALKNNQKYKVVWQVLQALRAHDDRFNATINQIELNKSAPRNIQIIGVGGGDDREHAIHEPTQFYLNFPNLEEWRNAIYGKIVLKCGDRRYWESWAKNIAQIAEQHMSQIKTLLKDSKPQHRATFADFLTGLQSNLNPSVTESDAIEMLSQHLITQPVFDALFQHEAFAKHNPVSQAMQKMLDLLEKSALKQETATLDKFYASVKQRAEGIDNAEGKQKIIIELYDKFFKTAFPRMSERLGIVYTPVEVVDFIIKSADYALRQEFGVGLTDKDVHILDPFTGTGTFMVRLLQSGLIEPKDLTRKYQTELHANEIVLLAYYIAAVNIEAAYHGCLDKGEYQPFNGIVLTDTFQLSEGKGYMKGWKDTMLPENSERAKKQESQAIQVIVGNPPYSAKQSSENDANKNLEYPHLDHRIRHTYAEYSIAANKQSLYDSYIRAIRWASDRIKDKGIVCYVSNGSFIDGNNMDGLRKCLTDEFSAVYCFNLRGNQRTSGETSRQEGGKIFGSGSRASIAISLLIKNPEKTGQCQLFYHDIGDYLSREDKLNIIKDFSSIAGIKWTPIKLNASYDWINQRDLAFDRFISLGDKKDKAAKVIFDTYVLGLTTSRDSWTYNFSKQNLSVNMGRMIDFYNQQVNAYKALLSNDKTVTINEFVDNDPKKINWSRGLKNHLSKLRNYEFQSDSLIHSMYRPFCKQWVYFNRVFNEYVYSLPKIFPNPTLQNLVICVTGRGEDKDFSALISDTLPEYKLIYNGQCFPLHTYEKQEDTGGLFSTSDEYVKQENIPDAILKEFRKIYKNTKISKEDIFYYVYGLLHSPEYKSRFAADLKKRLPRIPFAQDFKAFSQAGRDLAHWHLNYETIEPYPLSESTGELGFESKHHYQVQKMKFAGKAREPDKTTLIYNNKITLSGIPLQAYDYIVNGKSALEWIMERYQVTTDKASGIKNDPNDWSDDPRYIVGLVRRIVRVSLETMNIVDKLPKLNEKN